MCILSNCNRTEWSPIRSVIIRVIIKSDARAAEVRVVYHEHENKLSDRKKKKGTQREVENTPTLSRRFRQNPSAPQITKGLLFKNGCCEDRESSINDHFGALLIFCSKIHFDKLFSKIMFLSFSDS